MNVPKQWRSFQVGVWLLPVLPSLAVVALLAAAFGIWKRKYQAILSYRFNWGFGLLSLWLIFISGFALKPLDTLEGWGNFLPLFLVFPAFSLLLQSPAQLRQLAWAIVAPSLVTVIFGLGQLFAGWGSPTILSQLGLNLVPYGRPEGRMSSVFMYANIFAVYLLLAFILGLGLWLDTYRTWRRGKGGVQIWQLLFLSLALILTGIGLIFTNSRSAWGIALAAFLAFALYLGWRLLVLALTAAAGTVCWAAWGPPLGRQQLRTFVPSFFWQRLSDELYDRPLETLRATQWQFAWEMVQQRPWFGWGLRNFTPLYKAQMGLWLGHPHNFFLMLLGEAGIPTTLLFSGLVAWLLIQAVVLLRVWSVPTGKKLRYQRQRNHLILLTYLLAFCGCSAFNLFDVTIFDIRANLFGWLVLAAISGMVYRYRRLGPLLHKVLAKTAQLQTYCG